MLVSSCRAVADPPSRPAIASEDVLVRCVPLAMLISWALAAATGASRAAADPPSLSAAVLVPVDAPTRPAGAAVPVRCHQLVGPVIASDTGWYCTGEGRGVVCPTSLSALVPAAVPVRCRHCARLRSTRRLKPLESIPTTMCGEVERTWGGRAGKNYLERQGGGGMIRTQEHRAVLGVAISMCAARGFVFKVGVDPAHEVGTDL